MTKKLSRQEVAKLGLYDFLGYIDAFDSPYIGGLAGTRMLIERLGIPKDEDFRVLEVACASGFTSCMIAKEYGCQVTGIDISEVLISKAQDRSKRMGLTNVRFQVADATRLPFEDNSFDAVFGVAIVALLPMKEELLQEFKRVTKPGGSIGTLDLFAKSGADKEIVESFSTSMKALLEYDVAILDIQRWRSIFEKTGLDSIDVEENYTDVLLNTRKRSGTIKATMKMLYHMLINGAIRKRMMKLMGLRKTAIMRDDEGFEHLGYLVFTGRKMK
ncbi:MAG: class I SAM-dependent methyltransferase [Candidatus Thorarchaeota archaeon]